jgi:hypothetical protein
MIFIGAIVPVLNMVPVTLRNVGWIWDPRSRIRKNLCQSLDPDPGVKKALIKVRIRTAGGLRHRCLWEGERMETGFPTFSVGSVGQDGTEVVHF